MIKRNYAVLKFCCAIFLHMPSKEDIQKLEDQLKKLKEERIQELVRQKAEIEKELKELGYQEKAKPGRKPGQKKTAQ